MVIYCIPTLIKLLALQLNLFFAMDPRFGEQNIVMLLNQFMRDSAEIF